MNPATPFVLLDARSTVSTLAPTRPAKLLYSITDACHVLSLSRRSVQYLIAGNRLPVRRIGGRTLIPVASLEAFASMDHDSLTGNGQAAA